jgi:hypothetical protein
MIQTTVQRIRDMGLSCKRQDGHYVVSYVDQTSEAEHRTSDNTEAMLIAIKLLDDYSITTKT